MMSRKIKLIGACAIALVLLTAGAARAELQNLIGDPSFELGGALHGQWPGDGPCWVGVNRWYEAYSKAWLSRTGDWSCQVLTDDPAPVVHQRLPYDFEEGLYYSMSFYGCHDNGATPTYRNYAVGYETTPGDINTFYALQTVQLECGNRDWPEGTGSYTTGSSGSELDETIVVALDNGSGGWTGWLDDISLTARIPGDANLDGMVDGQDFTIMKANFGTAGDPGDPGTWPVWGMGNFNDDYLVDGQDFTIMKANFGRVYPPITSPAPVPEPASAALLLAALPWLIRRRRK